MGGLRVSAFGACSTVLDLLLVVVVVVVVVVGCSLVVVGASFTTSFSELNVLVTLSMSRLLRRDFTSLPEEGGFFFPSWFVLAEGFLIVISESTRLFGVGAVSDTTTLLRLDLGFGVGSESSLTGSAVLLDRGFVSPFKVGAPLLVREEDGFLMIC